MTLCPQAAPDIVVIGSANMDLVVRAAHIPRPGETVLGGDFRTVTGGKGANQAVAAARLGARVAFLGRTGDDDFGHALRLGLAAAGIDLTYCQIASGTPSGVALIVVDEGGQNAICVAPGANAALTPADIEVARELLVAARVIVVQLEIPLITAAYAVEFARRLGKAVVLDPAPAPEVVPPMLFDVDVLTPNEIEARTLLAHDVNENSTRVQIAEALRGRGARAVVLKCGASGSWYADDARQGECPAFAVPVVDTTAAGDAFTAALAVGIAEGFGLADATRFANAAGALACTQPGAQPSLPTRAAVERLLETGRV